MFPDEEWSDISEDAKDFIKKLMSKYPRRRPSAQEALEHPWFKSVLSNGNTSQEEEEVSGRNDGATEAEEGGQAAAEEEVQENDLPTPPTTVQ